MAIVFSTAFLLFSSVLLPALGFGASEHAIRVGLTDSARVLSIRSPSPFFLKLPSGKRFKISDEVIVKRQGERLLLNNRTVSASVVFVEGGEGIYHVHVVASAANAGAQNVKARMERSWPS